jgi:hypothetical protein
MSPIRYLSLPALKERLDQEFEGSAPSIATLKRWAASGVLNGARQTNAGRDGREHRVKFDYIAAKRIILTRWHTRQESASTGSNTPSVATESIDSHHVPGINPVDGQAEPPDANVTDLMAVPLAEIAAVQAKLQQLTDQFDIMTGLLREIHRDASELRAARTTLMRKYDESNSMQLQLIAELKTNRGGDSRGGDSILELSRISAGISRLSDRVAGVELALEEVSQKPPRR